MARPSKSVSVLNQEGKSHRTKAELDQREQAEASALTGLPLRESESVAVDPVAHAEYVRVCELMTAVSKNDALFEAVINDYCTYKSDIARYAYMREEIQRDLEDVRNSSVDAETKYKLKQQFYTQIINCDKQIKDFQKKRFDIEKENGFTIASAARSIPKTPTAKPNPILEALRDG